MAEKLLVHVTFDETRGYVATGADLPDSGMVTALSLSGLRRRVEAVLFPADGVDLVLNLDRRARRERDQRRKGGAAAGVWPR